MIVCDSVICEFVIVAGLRSGLLGQQRLRSVFLAMRVPVELDLLRELIQA